MAPTLLRLGESSVPGWEPSALVDHDWRSGQFATTFESTFSHYEAIERMFIELDGSFVWRGDGWQLDGHLYDRSDRLYFVELSGSSALDKVEQLLAPLKAEAPILCEHVREGVLTELATWLELLPS